MLYFFFHLRYNLIYYIHPVLLLSKAPLRAFLSPRPSSTSLWRRFVPYNSFRSTLRCVSLVLLWHKLLANIASARNRQSIFFRFRSNNFYGPILHTSLMSRHPFLYSPLHLARHVFIASRLITSSCRLQTSTSTGSSQANTILSNE